MFEEPDILDRDDRTSQPFGNFCQRGQDATLDEKLTDELLIDRIDLSHQTRLIRPQLLQRGKVFREVPKQSSRLSAPLSRPPPLGL